MFKYTRHSLKKLETIFKELDYTIRYEKGSFTSGYCMVEDKNIAVINKFFDVDGRINVLLEILSTIDVQEDVLTEASLKFYKKLGRLSAKEEEE